jgi:hypothetical protein
MTPPVHSLLVASDHLITFQPRLSLLTNAFLMHHK